MEPNNHTYPLSPLRPISDSAKRTQIPSGVPRQAQTSDTGVSAFVPRFVENVPTATLGSSLTSTNEVLYRPQRCEGAERNPRRKCRGGVVGAPFV